MKRTVRKFGGQGGFTMIEIVSVLVIIGIIAAVAIVRMTNTRTYDVISRVEVVKTHLRLAQSRAMNSNQIWGINFSDSSTYSMFNNGNTANVVRLPNQGADNVTIPGGVSITTTTPLIISFDAWGKPYTNAAATAAQSGSRTLTLTKGSDTGSIEIKQNTGYIP